MESYKREQYKFEESRVTLPVDEAAQRREMHRFRSTQRRRSLFAEELVRFNQLQLLTVNTANQNIANLSQEQVEIVDMYRELYMLSRISRRKESD